MDIECADRMTGDMEILTQEVDAWTNRRLHYYSLLEYHTFKKVNSCDYRAVIIEKI